MYGPGSVENGLTMERMKLDRWRQNELDELLRKASAMGAIDERIAFLSERFLGTPYQEGTLVGDARTPEQFVVNLAAVDCFTFLDYVEAMRLSESFDTFVVNLKCIRYRDGLVTYATRRHFFTDWLPARPPHVQDATDLVAGGGHVAVLKHLNRKADGGLFLEGLGVQRRTVAYIPAVSLDAEMTRRLRTGDYVGIFAAEEGLDVSHVGIAIRSDEGVLLRHASSRQHRRAVVDERLTDYLADRPGIVVVRPLTAR